MVVVFPADKCVDEKGLSQIALNCSLDPGVLALQLGTGSAVWGRIKRERNEPYQQIYQVLDGWFKSDVHNNPNPTYGDLRKLVSCGFEVTYNSSCKDECKGPCKEHQTLCQRNEVLEKENLEFKKENAKLNEENIYLQDRIAELESERTNLIQKETICTHCHTHLARKRQQTCTDVLPPDSKQSKLDKYFPTNKSTRSMSKLNFKRRPLRSLTSRCQLL